MQANNEGLNIYIQHSRNVLPGVCLEDCGVVVAPVFVT